MILNVKPTFGKVATSRQLTAVRISYVSTKIYQCQLCRFGLKLFNINIY